MASADNIERVIHKRKVSKEKTEVQQPDASRPIGYSTVGRVSQPSSPTLTEVKSEPTELAKQPKQTTIDQSAQARAESRANSIRTLEIDDYLIGLVMEGMADENYIPYYAKCCYTLGLQRVNIIVLQVRQAKCDPAKGQSREKLLAWKLKGAMQLHFKKQFYLDEHSPEQQHASA